MPRKGNAKSSQVAGSSSEEVGRFSYEGLDRIMHEKARLSILASLAANSDGVLFTDLKRLCSLTDGNLSRHLGVLNDAALVEIWKGTSGSRPQTMYRLTDEGREKFSEYIGVLEGIVADAQSKQSTRRKSNNAKFSGGWSPA